MKSSLIIAVKCYVNFILNTTLAASRQVLVHVFLLLFTSVQSLSHVRLFATPWIAARQASLYITNSRSSLKLMSIKSVMPSSHLILCHPLLLLPSIFPSIRVFSNELALRIRWPKYWSFSFSISPSNQHPGLTSFRMDWLYFSAVQGTLKSLLQHHSLKASILRRSAFFTVRVSHPYMTTGKTIALTRWTFVGKVMSLLFNMQWVMQKHTGCDRPHKSVAERSYPMPEVRGGGQEEQPHIQGAVAAWVQEGREELLHVQGQEGWLWGDTPCLK